MTKAQAQILDLMSRLSPEERIEVMDQIHASNLLPESFYDRMTPEQRAHLIEGIAQADRGEGDEASVVFDRLSKRLGLESAQGHHHSAPKRSREAVFLGHGVLW